MRVKGTEEQLLRAIESQTRKVDRIRMSQEVGNLKREENLLRAMRTELYVYRRQFKDMGIHIK